jgi:hypothetical protein
MRKTSALIPLALLLVAYGCASAPAGADAGEPISWSADQLWIETLGLE